VQVQANIKFNYVSSFFRIIEIHLQVLCAVEKRTELTQRGLTKGLGVGLGKAHYCMKSLIEKGLIKKRQLEPQSTVAGVLLLSDTQWHQK
jgi:DNA-binding MarR family transcriptional regulator